MKKIIFLIAIFPVLLSAQDFRANASRSIFADVKASRIGDAITIIVVESSKATTEANISAGRKSDIGLNLSGSMDGSPAVPEVDFDMGSRNDFKGGGSTSAGGMVKTKISALIDSVYENGLLRIRGERKISINGEEQIVTIKGLVRTADLSTNNSVYSYNISEAEIVFEGSGMIDSNTSPGWISKMFHWLF